MILVVFGPTGSGKTDVAVKLAHHFNAPIINADAFQIYKDMNIGTNKIKESDPDYKRHYLLNIKKPNETYSVKEYQDDFRRTLNELNKKYKDIIVSGGTGLYIRAALFDYEFLEEENSTNDYSSYSNEELFKKLEELDLEASKSIHVNNRKRLIRALDLISSSGKKKSEIIASQEHKIIYPDVEFLFLNPDREELYDAINYRVDKMISEGLVDEVEYLKEKYDLSTTATQAIGYKEILDYLDDKCSLEEAIELIKKRTRNYAKRQVTFFKNQFNSRVFTSKVALLKEFGINE
ncbi:MAG: tRNA (adenosine(37)-N6)-dimethylallyltransferase MiaA [Erysipelotrichaceae bacterium]|nr:tRNA (adenosine(37)-N6)-dimethylallyltransferase MiaA [Erysipelotrichaceae bacterium]